MITSGCTNLRNFQNSIISYNLFGVGGVDAIVSSEFFGGSDTEATVDGGMFFLNSASSWPVALSS